MEVESNVAPLCMVKEPALLKVGIAQVVAPLSTVAEPELLKVVVLKKVVDPPEPTLKLPPLCTVKLPD